MKPYFIYPMVKALREETLSAEETMRLRRIVAANVGDTATLRVMLGEDPEEFAHFYPDMEKDSPTTDDTIDSFIDKFGKGGMRLTAAVEEIPLSEELSPTVELPPAGGLSPTVGLSPADELSPAEEASAAPANPEIETPERRLTEREARRLIKAHDYQGALEIINYLHLNNPEKSIYFADQIRFLKKLILNQRFLMQGHTCSDNDNNN